MKVCHLCGDTYSDHVEFCFNDGEVLLAADVPALDETLGAAELDPPHRLQGSQSSWTDGTPVPVSRSSNRQLGQVPPGGPSPALLEETKALPDAVEWVDPDPDQLADAPVPAENHPRPGATPEPISGAAASSGRPGSDPTHQGPPEGGKDPVAFEPPSTHQVGSSATPGTGGTDPPEIVVPSPSIKVTPAAALTSITPTPSASSVSSAPTPILSELRAMTPQGEVRRPLPVDVDLSAPTEPRMKPLPPTVIRRSPQPSARAPSGIDSDSSNLLWLGAMFAVGVLFALVGGTIPLVWMLYSGSLGGAVSGGTPPAPSIVTPPPQPPVQPGIDPFMLPVPAPAPIDPAPSESVPPSGSVPPSESAPPSEPAPSDLESHHSTERSEGRSSHSESSKANAVKITPDEADAEGMPETGPSSEVTMTKAIVVGNWQYFWFEGFFKGVASNSYDLPVGRHTCGVSNSEQSSEHSFECNIRPRKDPVTGKEIPAIINPDKGASPPEGHPSEK